MMPNQRLERRARRRRRQRRPRKCSEESSQICSTPQNLWAVAQPKVMAFSGGRSPSAAPLC